MEKELNESQHNKEVPIVDPEVPEAPEATFKFDNLEIRMNFIRKVYLILLSQLLITAAFIAVSVASEGYQQFVKNQLWLFIVAIVFLFVSLYTLIYARSVARTVPWNYTLLGVFTLCEAYLASCTTAVVKPTLVLTAALITVAMVTALTVYAFTSKTDFTILGGILFISVAVLAIALLVALFIKSSVLDIALSSLVCILFGIYLIYDTQLIVGKHENALSPDDYIIGAMNLYVDITTIFIHLVKIISN